MEKELLLKAVESLTKYTAKNEVVINEDLNKALAILLQLVTDGRSA